MRNMLGGLVFSQTRPRWHPNPLHHSLQKISAPTFTMFLFSKSIMLKSSSVVLLASSLLVTSAASPAFLGCCGLDGCMSSFFRPSPSGRIPAPGWSAAGNRSTARSGPLRGDDETTLPASDWGDETTLPASAWCPNETLVAYHSLQNQENTEEIAEYWDVHLRGVLPMVSTTLNTGKRNRAPLYKGAGVLFDVLQDAGSDNRLGPVTLHMVGRDTITSGTDNKNGRLNFLNPWGHWEWEQHHFFDEEMVGFFLSMC